MPTLPLPEEPPPDTPDADGFSPRGDPSREPRRDCSGPVAPATVRLCLVDPTAGVDEIIAAVVSMITTTYTVPGDRIMLADPGPSTVASQQRRDRLVESVLRLGRGVSPTPDHPPRRHHEPGTPNGGPPATRGSGSGLGSDREHPAEPVANPTGHHLFGEPSGPDSDGVALILAGFSDHPADPFAMANCTPALAPDGALVVFTHRHDQCRRRAALSGRLSRAGWILADRLILTHEPPSAAPPPTEHGRRVIARGGHRRIHTSACVFRRSTPPPEEARHA